jgi:hypothetical protein
MLMILSPPVAGAPDPLPQVPTPLNRLGKKCRVHG